VRHDSLLKLCSVLIDILVPIENIKELRSTSDARYYREQFQLAQEYEDRWLTIIYIIEGNYKTLHLIASTKDIFEMWDTTLRKLYSIRQELMSGLGHVEMRQAVWEKQYWKGADDGKDQKLDFEETERLCKRLNVNSSTDALLRLFKVRLNDVVYTGILLISTDSQQADTDNRGFLDFPQFQRFVKMLKARPELDRLYKKICSPNNKLFDFQTFEVFMRQSQQVSLLVPSDNNYELTMSAVFTQPTGIAEDFHKVCHEFIDWVYSQSELCRAATFCSKSTTTSISVRFEITSSYGRYIRSVPNIIHHQIADRHSRISTPTSYRVLCSESGRLHGFPSLD